MAETRSKQMTFEEKTVKSALWTYLAYALNKSSTLIVTILLTHLIAPDAIGLVALAVTAMAFLDAVRDLGIGLALIQWQGDVEKAANTAFWLGIASNFTMWIISILVSPLVARIFNQPDLASIFPVLTFSFVINSIGNIHDALLQRQMAFRKRMIPDVWGSLIKGIITIGLALAGFTVWAIVIGQLVGRLVFSILVWRVNPWRPQREFSWDTAKNLLRYGYKISIDSLISAFQANVDYVFIGLFLSSTALGLYYNAYRIPEFVIINFCIVIAQVLFPAYAELHNNDKNKLADAILSTFRYIALITIPAGVGLALVSDVFVNSFFGAEWQGAAPMMAVLSLYGTVLAVAWNIGDVYKAVGRPDILWRMSLIEFIVLSITLFFMSNPAVNPYASAYAVTLGHLVVAATITSIRVLILSRLLSIPLTKILSQFTSAIIGAILLAFVDLVLLATLHTSAPLLQLILSVVIGAIVYGIAMWFLERTLVLRIIELIADRVPFVENIVKTSKN
jgi:O-antigen/teichoic acid export membrane protein